MNRSVWAARYRRLGRDAAFLLLSGPLSLLAFCLAVPLTAAGAGRLPHLRAGTPREPSALPASA